MPIDYKRYPKNWKQIRAAVMKRAENKCEWCGVENYSMVLRQYMRKKPQEIKVILTVAHLDHDETNENIQLDRLAALCQKCHLNYDRKEKMRRMKEKKSIIVKKKTKVYKPAEEVNHVIDRMPLFVENNDYGILGVKKQDLKDLQKYSTKDLRTILRGISI